MRGLGRSALSYRAAFALQIGSAVVLVIFGAADAFTPDGKRIFWAEVMSFLKQWSSLAVPVGTSLLLISKYANMNPWIRLMPSRLNHRRIEDIGGVPVEVYLSPYDVPEAVRSYRDDATGHLIVQFRYMRVEEPKEPLSQHWVSNCVHIALGKHSGRIYRMELDLSQASTGTHPSTLVSAIVGRAIDDLARERDGGRTAAKYLATQEAINAASDQLFLEFANS